MTSGLITSWQIEGGKVEAVTDFIFLGSRITADIDYSLKWKDSPWKESYDKPRQLIKKQRHHFAHKGPYSQNHTYGFPHSYLQMWALDHKEGWAPKNWCFQVVVLEKTLGSPLDSKEIKKIYPKGNQPWIFIGRTDAETPILWPPAVKSQLIGKDPEGERRRGWQRMTWFLATLIQWSWIWANSEIVKEQGHLLLLLLSSFSRVRLCATPQMAAH